LAKRAYIEVIPPLLRAIVPQSCRPAAQGCSVGSFRHNSLHRPAFGGVRCHFNSRKDRITLQVVVRENNVEQALRALKKKMQREGIFREMKARRSYEKPSEKRARQKAEAVRRSRKLARKQAQREGLLPMKKKPARPTGRPARPESSAA
jgi:small subunit ribosomal protein S21